jgi:hypothetical protein
MMRTAFLKPAYVKIVPDELENGTLYVSEYGTAVHKCCCGCGSEVVTPLGPTNWKLVKEGSAVSLHPLGWKLALALPVTLLDQARQGDLGGAIER